MRVNVEMIVFVKVIVEMIVVSFNQYLSFVILRLMSLNFIILRFRNYRFKYLLQNLIFRKTFVIKI